jgi:hypothetical protein
LAAVGLLGGMVALNAIGRVGEGPNNLALRIGFFRSHSPPYLLHAGFWLGALGAAWLGFARWRVALGARLLGRSALAVWLLAMLLTPVSGWNIQSHHFSYALGPLFTLVWCTIAWYAWRRLGENRTVALVGWALVGWCGLIGPSWALLGAESSASWARPAAMRHLQQDLSLAAIPDGSLVLVPRGMRGVLAGTTNHLAFAHEYLHLWAVPDSVIWVRQICAAVLTGEDSAEVTRALTPAEGGLPMWGWGRPSGVSLSGVRSYHQIAGRLATLEGAAVAAARRDTRLLRSACADRPDFAFAVGRAHVREALAAAVLLGATVRRMAMDSAWVWLDLRPGAGAARRL